MDFVVHGVVLKGVVGNGSGKEGKGMGKLVKVEG